MKGKILKIGELNKRIVPETASLISGSFDPFNSYYEKLLKWAASQSRPLVVVVHTDSAVKIRRGLIKPTEGQVRRASNVAKLDFVDYVVISDKPAHHKKLLELIRPKFLLFQRDNRDFLEGLFKMIREKFPKINIKVSSVKKELPVISLSANVDFENVRNPVIKKILELAKFSSAPVGKISAVLALGDKIVGGVSNSLGGDHAEKILLSKFEGKDLKEYSLYILIPPCPMCADSIVKAKISKVFYLFNYGDKLGIEKLKKAGIRAVRVKI